MPDYARDGHTDRDAQSPNHTPGDNRGTRGTQGSSDSSPSGTWRVLIDHHACEGREICIEVCPTDVFEMQPTRVRHPLFWLKAKAHGGKQAFAVRENACIGCMECVKVCPELAIAVTQASSFPRK